MARKLSSGVMVALIAILSLFGSVGQAFAANAPGGPSLSTLYYAEIGKSKYPEHWLFTNTLDRFTAQQYWAGLDEFMSSRKSRINDYDYYHVFFRYVDYDNKTGKPILGQDYHQFFCVTKGAIVKREDHLIKFVDGLGNNVPYRQYLSQDTGSSDNSKVYYQWQELKSSGYPVSDYEYETYRTTAITVFEKLTLDTKYDPNNPPAYAVPGNTDPLESAAGYDPNNPGNGGTNPSNPNDPDFPIQPTPPDNNWDLIGWLKYLVEWLIYIVKCFVYFLKSFGSAIGDVVTGSASLISAMSDFFAFLPNQVTTIIGMGILAMIIVGIVKR